MTGGLIAALLCHRYAYVSPIDEVVLKIVRDDNFSSNVKQMGVMHAAEFWYDCMRFKFDKYVLTERLSNNYLFNEGRTKYGPGEWWFEMGEGPYLEIHYVTPFPAHEKKIVFRYTEKPLVNLLTAFYNRL